MESLDGKLVVTIISTAVAVLSSYFSVNLWRRSNRPLITLRVTSTNKDANVSITLNIVVENTGNRPAKNITLSTSWDDLLDLMNEKPNLVESIKRCFSSEGTIPVLANGKEVSNSFGYFAEGDAEATWKKESRVDVNVSYEDLDGRRFTDVVPILIANDLGFAGSRWSEPRKFS